MASRLSEDPHTHVLLIEAGGRQVTDHARVTWEFIVHSSERPRSPVTS